ARADPRQLLPSARVALVAAARYADGADDAPSGSGQGRIARYARGADYHQVLRTRLYAVVEQLAQFLGETPAHRVCVDSAPLLERELAARAGVGFIGKNTMLISPGIGAYTLLGVLLLDVEILPDEPMGPRCGSCDLCLRACPTQALRAPYELDARRCISYATIEQRGDIDTAIADKHGDWVFGCDDCNQVCPFNRPTPESKGLAADPELGGADEAAFVDLETLANLRSGEYRRLVRGRALARAPRQSFQRNARIVLANRRREEG
ncbi:MAG: tRNA epoxyqueuosine(34) reductase QueG, partial [Myxococcales bacterium]|nr:tRNA epoxyqueuosine(34) reductase QueG [Myxococcales bacterium]